jgi:bifunctional non-homologous end joining protein LigD
LSTGEVGDEVELYSRNGSRFSRRFPLMCEVIRELPARSAIIDGEIVANDAAGMPDFWRLFLRSARPAQLHIWAFDLLAFNNLEPLPAVSRSRIKQHGESR